jgi:predicted aldo/keto reductase-like oxidoreductase
VTGHTDPAVLNRVISRYDFDTMLMPLSVTDGGNRQKSFETDTLPVAQKKGMGVIAMKTLGAGAILQNKAATRDECLQYVWTLPVSTAILGCQEVGHVEANIALARMAKSVAREALRERVRSMEIASMEPCKARVEPERRYRAD